MKILLDACVDWQLARDIVGHEVKTARQMGWATVKNGELLALASVDFEVFLTVDRNLSFQQNLPTFAIAVVVLCAKSNRLADLRPLIPKLLSAIPMPNVALSHTWRSNLQFETDAWQAALAGAAQLRR